MGSNTFDEQSSVRLQCTVQGIESPNIVWLKQNQDQIEVVLSTTRISISTNSGSANTIISTLHIINAEPSDQGLYVCEATGIDRNVLAVANHNLTIDGTVTNTFVLASTVYNNYVHYCTQYCKS